MSEYKYFMLSWAMCVLFAVFFQVLACAIRYWDVQIIFGFGAFFFVYSTGARGSEWFIRRGSSRTFMGGG